MLKAQAARSPILLSKFAIEYLQIMLAAVRVLPYLITHNIIYIMTDSLSQRMHNVQFQDLQHLN